MATAPRPGPGRLVSGAERAARAIRALYGDDLVAAAGVLHVAAAWASPGRALVNMRITDGTPSSDTDAFALAVARARADAIVTTGRILREETGLRFTSPRDEAWGLGAWRRTRLGREQAPWIVVLTRGPGLEVDHPALIGHRTLVLTSHAAARAGRPSSGGAAVEWIGREAPGLLDALAYLRGVHGLATVLVEAGPSTSAALYEAPGHVDELMLSICHVAALPPGVKGEPFLDEAARGRAGLVEVARTDRDEASGRWTFTRWRRG
jgi:riboflavin biosynthesis pyrimidine reductase